jgi:4-alpha-glucanotransferase
VTRPHLHESDLLELASLYGVLASYRGADHKEHEASAEALLSIIRSLGGPVETSRDVPSALRARRVELARRIIEPVIVVRENARSSFLVTLPDSLDVNALWLSVQCEDGTTRHNLVPEDHVTVVSRFDSEGLGRVQLQVTLDAKEHSLPCGYHHLTLEVGATGHTGPQASTFVICAPRCPQPDRGWGAFLPLHALRTSHDWGVGSYADLASMGAWVRGHGASMMGSLPLYPTYLDPPIDPSPYRPVSRLAYNEIYIDPLSLAELEASSDARGVLNSSDFQARVDAARRQSLVDYEEVARLRRLVLQPMATALLESTSSRRSDFESFAAQHPELVAYSDFRARVERDGRVGNTTSAPVALTGDPLAQYYLYCQWAAAQQLGAAAKVLPLYADVPVGVHPEGFDPVWSPTSFVTELSGGAPPDLFFSQGQNWSFAPLHPEAIRESHYDYLRAVFARAFRHASCVRVDHVMGLSRLYVMPEGANATQGAYVRYHSEELFALVALESSRAGASVVGEDLGTVPSDVHECMDRDGMLRSWVFEFKSTLRDPLPTPRRNVLASLATHDTARFSTFLWGGDIDEMEAEGHLNSEQADARRATRALYREALFRALEIPVLNDKQLTDAARQGCLEHLSASDASLLLVDLEELLGESEPQNRPGTSEGNWQRRAALTLEEMRDVSRVRTQLERIDQLRRGAA